MNLSKLLVLLLSLTLFVACDKEEDNCTQADWVGTYVGSQSGAGCFGTGSTTVTITASGEEAIVIVYEDTDGTSSEYDPITPNACNISETGTQLGITFETEITLEGNELTIVESIGAVGVASTCTITATKQ